MNKKKHQSNFFRILYAVISTILFLRVMYLRGELPIPKEDGLFIQLFGYFIVFPGLIIMAWLWDKKIAYQFLMKDTDSTKNNIKKVPIKYETYLFLGTLIFFVIMVFFIVTSFIFPVPTTYHYGR